MTEEQIKMGYERLGSAVRPPQDALDRVETRMRARRRGRRLGVAAGAAVVVATVGGYAVASLGGSGDGRDGVVAVDPPPYSLVMTRPDGSTYEFEDLTISCDPPGTRAGEGGSGDRNRVYLYSPMLIDGEQLRQPFVLVEVDLERVEPPRTFTLPIEGADGSSETMPLVVFLGDTEGASDGNEVSGSSLGSTGTARITKASCDPTPVLELEVDATLGSEEHDGGQAKQSLELVGSAG